MEVGLRLPFSSVDARLVHLPQTLDELEARRLDGRAPGFPVE